MEPVDAGHAPDEQRARWEASYRDEPALFGDALSEAAVRAAGLFREDGARRVLEFGGFVVRFFDRALVERLAEGFVLDGVDAFPRRLLCVTMHHPGGA